MDKTVIDSLLYELDQAYLEIECLRKTRDSLIALLCDLTEQLQKLKEILRNAEIYIHGQKSVTLDDILKEIMRE